jgi:hypothetical protein
LRLNSDRGSKQQHWRCAPLTRVEAEIAAAGMTPGKLAIGSAFRGTDKADALAIKAHSFGLHSTVIPYCSETRIYP